MPAIRAQSAPRLSVIIVDDEEMARARLRRLLGDETDVDIVLECTTGREAVEAIVHHSPDLVFLDVEMPELTGFQVLESLPADRVPTFVFVTAFNEYAIEAFAVDALDYLLKPFTAERFKQTMQRARERSRDRTTQGMLAKAIRELGSPPRYAQRLTIRENGSIVFVRVDDIDYIESAANYVRVCVGKEQHRIRDRLSNLAERLDPARFARIHRTTIVNVDRIKEIQPWFSGDAVVILASGVKLRLSRGFRSGLDLGPRSRA
jgi:two-component system LytT family response regulator